MNKIQYSKILLAIVILFSLGMSSCKKNFERLVAVKTTSVNSTSFLAQGEVIDVGDLSPEYGFYYSYSPALINPAIYKVGTTSSPKTFQASFEGLPSGTYYIAAYAKSSQGTIFGDVLTFTVSGGDVDYYWDDGTSEYSWKMNPGYDGYMGNLFPVTTSGFIKSVKAYFTPASDSGSDMLQVEFFDQNQLSIGYTNPFTPYASTWITIAGLSIPFNGNFYAMVHWNYVMAQTNYLAMDQNGPNVSMDLGYAYSGGVWSKLSSESVGNMKPGIFLLRVTAQITGKDKRSVIAELGPPVTPGIQYQAIKRTTADKSSFQAMPVKP